MTTIEIVDSQVEPGDSVARLADLLDLRISSDGQLKSLPGSRHWHLKKPTESGTLEVTHWPKEGRLWVCYHSNRVGSWVAETAPLFARKLAAQLGGRVAEA